MLGSAVFTLVYPTIHDLIPLKTYPLAESRVLVVTLLTTFVWVLVTFLTTNQSEEVRLKMLPILGSRHQFVVRFGVALKVGISFLGLVTGIWFLILG